MGHFLVNPYREKRISSGGVFNGPTTIGGIVIEIGRKSTAEQEKFCWNKMGNW